MKSHDRTNPIKKGSDDLHGKNCEKCKTCTYTLGYVKTLVNPCVQYIGKTSIFASYLMASRMNGEKIIKELQTAVER